MHICIYYMHIHLLSKSCDNIQLCLKPAVTQTGRRGGDPGGRRGRRRQPGSQVETTFFGLENSTKQLLRRSVEFFSIPKQEWVSLADMTIARLNFHYRSRSNCQKFFFGRIFYFDVTRTEHGLAVINGIPTVGLLTSAPNTPPQTQTNIFCPLFACTKSVEPLQCSYTT